MKKVMLFLASFCPLLCFGQAQPTNGGFEEWVMQDSFLTPVGWENYSYADEPSPAVFQQIEDPFAGDYALYIFPEKQFEGYWPQGKSTKIFTPVLPKAISVAMQCFDIELNGFCEVLLNAVVDGNTKLLASFKLTSQTVGYLAFSKPITQSVSIFEHLEIICRAGSTGPFYADGNAIMVVDEIFLAYDLAATEAASDAPEIQVFPNPAFEELFVAVPPMLNSSELTLRIFDTQGKLKEKRAAYPANQTWQIAVTGWASGLYFLQVEQQGVSLKREKFMVVR